jgi:hypothetical protein
MVDLIGQEIGNYRLINRLASELLQLATSVPWKK